MSCSSPPIAIYAMGGRSHCSRLDMPTLDHVLAVEEWRNGRKWADFGLTGFGSGMDLADVHLRHRAECDRPYVRDCSDLRAGSKRSAGCRH